MFLGWGWFILQFSLIRSIKRNKAILGGGKVVLILYYWLDGLMRNLGISGFSVGMVRVRGGYGYGYGYGRVRITNIPNMLIFSKTQNRFGIIIRIDYFCMVIKFFEIKIIIKRG
jgi:hypothetical protein